jgi:uncharacterized protein (DUF58 family)
MSLPAEIIKNVRRIELRTRKIVNNIFSGEYHSVFKGQGMEFDEVREYQYGDDVRMIDWNVTARTGSPHIKKFCEERELTVMLMVDASGSGDFGTGRQLKAQMAVEICALLAFSAIKNNDRVGLIIFTDRIEKYVPPRKGRSHVLRVIRELLYFKPSGKKTDIGSALDYLNKVIRRRAVVFVISDFLDSDWEKPLQVANKKHDTVAIAISDRREKELPDVGLIELEDAETGEVILVDTSDPQIRKLFADESAKKLKDREVIFKKRDVDFVEISTEGSYVEPLVRFFRKRAARN